MLNTVCVFAASLVQLLVATVALAARAGVPDDLIGTPMGELTPALPGSEWRQVAAAAARGAGYTKR